MYTGRGKIILDGPGPDVTNRASQAHIVMNVLTKSIDRIDFSDVMLMLKLAVLK